MEKKIDWEQRRFEASALILAGMCSNYHNTCPSPYRAEDAVRLADSLIAILADEKRPSLCDELYGRTQAK